MGLVERFCPFGTPHCDQQNDSSLRPIDLCPLAANCPYGVLIATGHGERPKVAFHVPPLRSSEKKAAIELTLYGDGWRHYPWVLATTAEVLKRGIGERRESWRLVRVDKVTPSGELWEICRADPAQLDASLTPDVLGLGHEPFVAHQPVAVDLLSPCRFSNDSSLIRSGSVPFAVLIARILDRCAGLYGKDSSALLRDLALRRPILEAASEVEVLDDQTHWVDVPDYSSRQDRGMFKGGKVGRIVYGPTASRFCPILQAGTILQVGKNAGSGCGRFEVEFLPPT